MKLLTISVLTISLSFSATIVALAHCGSTWITEPPTFGPVLGSTGCIAGSNPTTTSKTVVTHIHFAVGDPITHPITDSGMNKLIPGFFSSTCVRCFPTFNTPEFKDEGNGITSWNQQTKQQIVDANNSCVESSRQPIEHHFIVIAPSEKDQAVAAVVQANANLPRATPAATGIVQPVSV